MKTKCEMTEADIAVIGNTMLDIHRGLRYQRSATVFWNIRIRSVISE